VRSIALATVAAAALAASPAGAEDEDPPCPAGTAPTATIHADDLEDVERAPLIATHTIDMELETSDGESIDDFEFEVPPGVRKPQREAPRFQADTPGAVLIKARWLTFSNQLGTFCTATTEGTVTVEPARRPRFSPPPRRSASTEIDWFLRLGKHVDRRPIQLRVRAIHRARVPRRSARLRTVTYALRVGDKGVSLGGNSERVLRTPAGRFFATFRSNGDIWVGMRELRRPAFGIDLQLVQGGHTLGRTRLKARCNAYFCRYRTVR
jgi:hypothetical protein